MLLRNSMLAALTIKSFHLSLFDFTASNYIDDDNYPFNMDGKKDWKNSITTFWIKRWFTAVKKNLTHLRCPCLSKFVMLGNHPKYLISKNRSLVIHALPISI